jgi:hypothetical protein
MKKRLVGLFHSWHPKNRITKLDGNALHLIGTAGNELWATGEDSLPLYAGKERWQIWRRKITDHRS